jgi:hypothetical protein
MGDLMTEKITAFVTRQALGVGIFRVEGYALFFGEEEYFTDGCVIYPPCEWAKTRELAIARAEQARMNEIARLAGLTFTVKDRTDDQKA